MSRPPTPNPRRPLAGQSEINMSASDVRSVSPVIVLNPVSAANTAAATSGWIDVRSYEGDIAIIQQIGAITGTLDGKIQDATDGSGTGAADIAGLAYTQVTTANNVQKLVIRASSTRGYIKYVGTVVTGPAIVGVSALARTDTV